jgi:adenylosuccinate lyase
VGYVCQVRHLDRHIRAAWEEAEEETGRPKVEIAWMEAVAPENQIAPGPAEVLAPLWEASRHDAFQNALKAYCDHPNPTK